MVRRRPVFSAVLSTVAGILILASGCVDRPPTAVQLDGVMVSAKSSLASGNASVLFSVNKSKPGAFSSIIGSEGGTLNFGIGNIVFPAGAVERPTRIEARIDGTTLAVMFTPHVTFPVGHRPVLSLSYATARGELTELQIVHIGDRGEYLENMATTVDTNAKVARTNVSGFSGYALISQ